MARDTIAILDFGSSNNSGIARIIRKAGVYSEIVAHDITLAELAQMPGLKGLIFNGGPNRAYEGQMLEAMPEVLDCPLPKLAVGCNFNVSGENLSAWDGAEADVINRFINTSGIERNWSMEGFIEDQIAALRKQIGDKKVLLALSGGVDSSVVAALLLRAIGDQLTCVHVNHGLLRKGEPEQVVRVFKREMGANLIYVDAVDRFLDKLAGVADPEQKRKIIGAEFIRVFEEEARKLDDISFLGQGTIYPDILESGTKTAKNIKSHHNVGGLPSDLQFELVEPLKQLFKDEVRAVGEALGLPHSMVYRQPFPGPGLGVRCVGAITRERLEQVRESDAILREEFENAHLDQTVWQYFTIVPDIRSTGVRNHERCWERPVIIRAVNTQDAITASIEEIPYPVLAKIVNRIVNEVPGVNRVLYDLSPKPVATIEWE
ncbi:MAG: glutamine-hydrolyzing GMP synthase [Clostridia bacterium]|nr:glutamine-hydrolyzing GMP synthase [Clostridia bacterium]